MDFQFLHVSVSLILNPAFLTVTLIALGAWLIIGDRLARRHKTNRLMAFSASMSLAAILALTAPVTTPQAVPYLAQAWSSSRAVEWMSQGWLNLSVVPQGVEGLANVILYIPGVCLWSLITKRRVLVMTSFIFGSLVIETLQAALAIRVADPRDFYANSLGSFIGAVLAALIARFAPGSVRHPKRVSVSRPHAPYIIIGSLLSVALLLGVGDRLLDSAAEREQTRLLVKVRDAYADTRFADIIEAAGDNESLAFASRPGIPADYLGLITPDSIEARFNINSTVRPRCIIVTWAGTLEAAFVAQSGPGCLKFREAGLPSPEEVRNQDSAPV